MKKENKRLAIIAVVLFFIAVISFMWKKQETNFNLDEMYGPPVDESKEDYSKRNYSIRLSIDGDVKVLPLEDYVIGVVAGEMPASFEVEALKAQAVASRTFALYKKKKSGTVFDITSGTDSQVYAKEEEMRKKWGNEYQKYYDKIKRAVDETEGEVLVYKGDLIEAFYFSMSSGSTNDAAGVFGENRDYLKSVTSEYDNASLRGYETSVSFSLEEFKNRLDLSCENVIVNEIRRSESHYVEEITICDRKYTGASVRSFLGLRSADFDIEVEDEIEIVTRGYGHGVGMSQYGANGYAKSGYSYDEILKHYYRGVEISNIKDV